MAKVALFVGLLAYCILVSSSSAYKTISITTTTIHHLDNGFPWADGLPTTTTIHHHDNGFPWADGLPTTTTTIHHNDNGFPWADGLPTTTTIHHHDNGFPWADGLPTTTTIDNGFPWADGLPTTTTIHHHDNGFPWGDGLPRGGGSQDQQCQQVQQEQLNHCQMHLIDTTQDEPQHLQLCCDQLKQVRPEQCQCEAIQNVVQQTAQRFQQKQQGRRGGQGQGQQMEVQEILRKAQMLPQQCNLQVKQCQIRLSSRIPSSWF